MLRMHEALPLLILMSIQQGDKCPEKPIKGRGILLGGIPGATPDRLMLLGADFKLQKWLQD